MRKENGTVISSRALIIFLFSVIVYFGTQDYSKAQGPEDPPRPITVSSTQNLAFGTFYHDPAGGSVTVYPDGTRTATPGIVVFPGLFAFAVFEIIGNPGTVITITNGPDILLSRVGGGTMNLHIGSSLPVAPFVLSAPYPVPTQLKVGGTLTVGPPGDNPPGNYNGTFEIIFNQN